ncbi:MAG: hypothetical protein K8S00_09860 [Bacteroidales bacterium]|nr:hypothetical protein [Bacteroidales bacterium]
METATTTEWKINKTTGKKYCETLPKNTRVAKLEDFYLDGEIELDPVLIINKPFLVHSYTTGWYWACRTNKNFPYPESDFNVFLENDRVYVFEG